MTSAIIDSIASTSMPTWLFVLILVGIFIAVSAVTGYLTFKFRVKSSKGVRKKDEHKSAE
jgi:heme/copper-type cytochrome/quinol oxidase subunit 2